jgi:hypothetical protein
MEPFLRLNSSVILQVPRPIPSFVHMCRSSERIMKSLQRSTSSRMTSRDTASSTIGDGLSPPPSLPPSSAPHRFHPPRTSRGGIIAVPNHCNGALVASLLHLIVPGQSPLSLELSSSPHHLQVLNLPSAFGLLTRPTPTATTLSSFETNSQPLLGLCL